MTKKAQIQALRDCKTVEEWAAANEKMHKDGIYPKWYWKEIIESGLAYEVCQKFPKVERR